MTRDFEVKGKDGVGHGNGYGTVIRTVCGNGCSTGARYEHDVRELAIPPFTTSRTTRPRNKRRVK